MSLPLDPFISSGSSHFFWIGHRKRACSARFTLVRIMREHSIRRTRFVEPDSKHPIRSTRFRALSSETSKSRTHADKLVQTHEQSRKVAKHARDEFPDGRTRRRTRGSSARLGHTIVVTRAKSTDYGPVTRPDEPRFGRYARITSTTMHATIGLSNPTPARVNKTRDFALLAREH